MNLRQLRYFTSVVRAGSFSKAASRLNMAQQPLSRQIHHLEEELEVKLFEPGCRPLCLTDHGRFVYERALDVLDRAESIRTLARRAGSIESGQLRIGFVGSVLYGPLPDMVRRFRAAYPGLCIDMVELPSIEQVSALKEGRIDVGFGRLNVDDAIVVREILVEEPLVAALPIGHTLLHSLGPLPLKELRSQTLILYPTGLPLSYADEVLSFLEQRGVVGNMTRETRDVQTALGMVAAGVGISLVPAAVSRSPRENVVYRTLEDPAAISPVVMFRRGDDNSHGVAALLPLVRQGYRAGREISGSAFPDP